MFTKIDELINILNEKNRITLNETARQLGITRKAVEKISIILDRAGMVKLTYPINPLSKPYIEPKGVTYIEKEVPKPEGKLLEEYNVSGLEGHISAAVEIIFSKSENRPTYYIGMRHVSPPTRAYFETIKNEISRKTPIGSLEKTREEAGQEFAERHNLIAQTLEEDIKPKEDKDELCGILLREMYGLGEIDVLIADNWLEEIIINSSKEPIAVYHRKHGWLKTNLRIGSEDEIENYASQIARKIGKQINLLNPILDAHLATGDRVNATMFPISASGNTITLRLFSRNPWTIVNFMDKNVNALSLEMGALLWQAIHYEMNIIIGGGTASGKTSALNSVLALVPSHQRVITIEDTRELLLPSYQWNWVPLVTRAQNPEGLGEVGMLDLVVNSLRMRPDRIVMGEIRRKKEAEVLFEAMHTGHSVYGTIHADTGSQVLKRLMEPPMEIPPSEVEDIHLLMVQYRDRRKNIRRTLEISEVTSGPTGPEINHIYLWRPRTDKFQLIKTPRRYIEQLNLHTGMTEKEITEDQRDKQAVLEWMVENNMKQVEDVGKVMKAYYADANSIVRAAQKKIKPEKIFE